MFESPVLCSYTQQTASEVLKAKILQLKNEINQAGVEKVAGELV